MPVGTINSIKLALDYPRKFKIILKNLSSKYFLQKFELVRFKLS